MFLQRFTCDGHRILKIWATNGSALFAWALADQEKGVDGIIVILLMGQMGGKCKQLDSDPIMIELGFGENYQRHLKRSRYVAHDEKLLHPVKYYITTTVLRSLEKMQF